MTKRLKYLFFVLFTVFTFSLIFKNMFLFIIPIIAVNLFTVYELIKIPLKRGNSIKMVSSKIEVDCSEIPNTYFWLALFLFYIAPSVHDFKINTLYHFSTSSFKQQFLLLSIFTAILTILILLFLAIYANKNTKNGMVFKEGIIFNDGNLYLWDCLTGYKFDYSVSGSKYRELTLNYGKISKTLRIKKTDFYIFEDLINKKYFKLG